MRRYTRVKDPIVYLMAEKRAFLSKQQKNQEKALKANTHYKPSYALHFGGVVRAHVFCYF